MPVRHTVRYAHTDDGLAIPYTVAGHGVPLVHMPLGFGMIDPAPGIASWIEALEQRFQFVTYDGRGTGLAPRRLAALGLCDIKRDLDAVVTAAGLSRYVLFAPSMHAPAAVLHAARNRERVVALVLFNPIPAAGWLTQGTGMVALARANWAAFLHLVVSDSVPPTAADVDARVQHLDRQVSLDHLVLIEREGPGYDIRRALAEVDVPTLVFASATLAGTAELPSAKESSEGIAAMIPGAVLEILPGPNLSLLPSFQLPILATMEPFLDRAMGLADRLQSLTPDRNGYALTVRERDVLRLLAHGSSNAAIGDALVISDRTVARHVANIYEKIDAHNRAEATMYAVRHGIAAVGVD